MFTEIPPPSTDEVYKLIRSMPSKSSTMDKIPTSVIKTRAATFAPLVARLITLSFSEGKFPDELNKALVTLLLKKDGLDTDVYGNYRPISNLHTISKVVERAFLVRLAAHIKPSPKLQPVPVSVQTWPQHRNCTSPDAERRRYLSANNGLKTTLQLDLSSAFDTIDMCTLLYRL